MKDFTFTEGDLQIEITGVVDARKFDEPSSHGLSHCMKAVDFIVERSDCYLLIEFKDPQAPGAKRQRQQNFFQKFQSGKIDEDFKYKYRDSFLYEWASGRAAKPIHFLVLVALNTLTTADLGKRTDALKKKLPLQSIETKFLASPICPESQRVQSGYVESVQSGSSCQALEHNLIDH